MSTEESNPEVTERLLGGYLPYVIGAMVVCAIAIAAVFGLRTSPRAENKTTETNRIDPLDIVTSGLAKTTDYGTCKNSVQQLNLYFSQHPERKSHAIPEEQRERITTQYLADPKQISEIEGSSFTPLDAHYLESCFLFRDAALSLEVNGLPQSEQAEAAFRWVVRQVRLRNPVRLDDAPTPPTYVLRRGSGTVEERSLVYFALLQQLGIHGCIIASTDPDGANPAYWACGALVEEKSGKNGASAAQILLFDPRMGVPLPGPDGQGVLTLAALCGNPELLTSLNTKTDFPYDITPAKLAKTEIHLVAPLSTLAPRMLVLEKDLSAASVAVRLSLDIEDCLKRFANAAPAIGDKKVPVRVARNWSDVLRRFLPPDEGGADTVFRFDPKQLPGFVLGEDFFPVEMTHKRLFELELTAWKYLPPFVAVLPWTSELGQRPRSMYARIFVTFYLEPRQPRDQVLRGRYDEAVENLVAFREQLKNFEKSKKEAAGNKEFHQALNDFGKKANEVFGDLARAEPFGPGKVAEAKQRVGRFWEEADKILGVALQGNAAVPLKLEATFQLAMTKHEQATRLQARIERDRKPGVEANAADVLAAKNAWKTALDWWDDRDLEPIAPVVRWHKAEAYLALGRNAAARAALEDLSGDLTRLEKTARLYRASKIKD